MQTDCLDVVEPSPAHRWFLENLPEIRSRVRACFARFRPEQREEAVADVIAFIFGSCVNAARRDHLQHFTVFHAVEFAVRQYRGGRRFAGSSTTDALGEGTRLRGRCRVVSLDDPVGSAGGADGKEHGPDLAEVLSDRREQDPLERVRQRSDYPAILRRERVSAKAKRVFELISAMRGQGCGLEIAAALGVTPPRVSQLKARLADALARHGYGPAAA